MKMFYWFYLALIVVTTAVYKSLTYLQRKTMWCGPKLDAHEIPTDLPAHITFVQLSSDAVIGTSHLAVYVPTEPRDDLPWLIFTHGIMQHCEQQIHFFDQFDGFYNVVLWDYRGFGRSTGTADRTICALDLRAVVLYVHEHYCRSENSLSENSRLVLMGSSLGTNVTLHFLEHFDHHIHFVTHVILCHPFYSLQDVFGHIGAPETLAYVLGKMDVSDILPKYLQKDIKRRALILGSSEDPITPWHKVDLVVEECERRGVQEQLQVFDTKGTHFQINDLMFEKIKNLFI